MGLGEKDFSLGQQRKQLVGYLVGKGCHFSGFEELVKGEGFLCVSFYEVL